MVEGYTPVQIHIQNNSSDPMYLSPNNFSIPLCDSSEVASQVHTSTVGRVVVWGIAGCFFLPFLVPAILDGFRSAHANDALDTDYAMKAVKEYTIQPHCSFSCIAFVSNWEAGKSFNMHLVNLKTNEKVEFFEIPIKQRY